jgi:HEAT repeat protein
MRLILTSVAAVTLLGLSGHAFAHGGAYRGPAGEVPPDSREPSDPPPPPEGGGPGTPGGEDPGGPTTGGGDVGGPGTPGGGSGGPPTSGGGGPPPAGGGGGGPTTGGGLKRGTGPKGPGYEDWTFWWNFNKDEILNLKSIIKQNQRGAPTGSGAHALGSRGGSGTQVKTATDTAIQNEIVPELRALMEQKDLNFDIQSAAELALAKIGDTSIVEKLMEFARNDGANKVNKVVEESAALALGLMQKDTADVREFLIEMVRDKKRNNSFVRPFSAVSLGLLGSANDKDNVVPKALVDIVNGDEAKDDIKPTALLALGLLKNDSQCETLLNMLKTWKSADGKTELKESELAFVVQALGKIGRPGLDKPGQELVILDTVLAQLDEKSKAERNVRRSAAIALGQFAPKCEPKLQKKIVTTLKSVIDKTDDSQERHFALIALGRIGATAGMDKEVRSDCVKVLNYYLDKGKQLTPPFAALGLGLIGRQMSMANEVVDEDTIRKPLRDKYAETKEPRARGAYAVASGLIRDRLAVPGMIEVLKDSKADSKLRGYTALGLGMIGDPSAREAIRNALTNDSDRELRVQTAVAAGLMGDASVIPDLVKILESGEESQYILGSVALALGQIGDERAIKPLLGIVKDDKKYPDLTRALATVALGQIGDRRDQPVLARVSTDINYRAHVPALTELLTIL